MGNNPKISVIVPVYNAQHYLDRCVNSIIHQSFDDIEIILINDGSTDLSGQMCDEFAAKDGRIKVFHQTNKGISYTRQFGIDHSAGEFIQFVDSDDHIANHMLAELYGYASDNHLDIVGSNFVMELGSKTKRITCQYPTPERFREAVLSNEWGVVWKIFIRKSLFATAGISFPTGINHGEDYIVCVKLLLSTDKIATIDLFGYHYNYIQTDTSLTRNSGIRSTMDQIYATTVVEEYLNSDPDLSKYKKPLTKRKLFYARDLVTDTCNIIFKQMQLNLASSLRYLSPRWFLTFIILVFAKLKILVNSYLKR